MSSREEPGRLGAWRCQVIRLLGRGTCEQTPGEVSNAHLPPRQDEKQAPLGFSDSVYFKQLSILGTTQGPHLSLLEKGLPLQFSPVAIFASEKHKLEADHLPAWPCSPSDLAAFLQSGPDSFHLESGTPPISGSQSIPRCSLAISADSDLLNSETLLAPSAPSFLGSPDFPLASSSPL